jgi:hypothetical protein
MGVDIFFTKTGGERASDACVKYVSGSPGYQPKSSQEFGVPDQNKRQKSLDTQFQARYQYSLTCIRMNRYVGNDAS